jgi:hypothetical protein
MAVVAEPLLARLPDRLALLHADAPGRVQVASMTRAA